MCILTSFHRRALIGALSALPPLGYAQTDMLLTMTSALDYDEKNKDKKPTELVADKLSTSCRNMAEKGSGSHQGFAWDYYAPYFIALEKAGYVPVFSYLIHSAADQPDVKQWLE
ncbi:hypothetical protein LJY25_02920 [Hymenobacter sp. BT175]|uniref:hypothetical protein n=1 Tax=Hymenobacter translucens TaxID=2886507 RepID=UPI001D0E8676|nr:hypothetical protein [Hymenobacter translucens]MCC2545383.1 hypothetical protein [Hymenobacter translucens]